MGGAAFCSGQEAPTDDEVWERLTGAGVEPWLAERLLIFLPMAFTRRLLAEVSYQDRLVTPGGPVNLSAERVFVAAAGRAQRASCWRRCARSRLPARCTGYACSLHTVTASCRPTRCCWTASSGLAARR